MSVLGARDRPRKGVQPPHGQTPVFRNAKQIRKTDKATPRPGRQQSTTLGPGSQFRTTTDRLWTKPARRWCSIEACHFGSIAAGFNARTSNPRNALSEMRCARQRQRAVTWPAGRSQPPRDGSNPGDGARVRAATYSSCGGFTHQIMQADARSRWLRR